MTARIEPANAPFASDVQKIFSRLPESWQPPFSYFRTLARDPRLLKCAINGAPTYLPGSHINVRTREVLLLRVTARAGGEYEWGMRIHYFAEEAGLTEEQIYSTVHGAPGDSCWSEPERVVLRLADALEESCSVDDVLWTSLTDAFSSEAIMEMVQLAGYYRAVCAFTNAYRLPLEEGRSTPFPSRLS